MRGANVCTCRRALWVLGHAGTLLGCPPWAAFLRHAQAQGCLFAAAQPFDSLLAAAGGQGWTPAALPATPQPVQAAAVKRKAGGSPRPDLMQRGSRAEAGAGAQQACAEVGGRAPRERNWAAAADAAAPKRPAGGDSSKQRPAKRLKPLAAVAAVEGPAQRREAGVPGQGGRAAEGADRPVYCHAGARGTGSNVSTERFAVNTGSSSDEHLLEGKSSAALGVAPPKNPKVTAFANPMLAVRSLPSAAPQEP